MVLKEVLLVTAIIYQTIESYMTSNKGVNVDVDCLPILVWMMATPKSVSPGIVSGCREVRVVPFEIFAADVDVDVEKVLCKQRSVSE